MIPIELKRVCVIKLTKTQNKLYISTFLMLIIPSISILCGNILDLDNMMDLEFLGQIFVDEHHVDIAAKIVIGCVFLFFIVCSEE